MAGDMSPVSRMVVWIAEEGGKLAASGRELFLLPKVE
jgi:hypothetical protein